MTNKDKFLKITKNILKTERKFSGFKSTNPSRDWLIGILIGVIIFAGSALWSLQTYTKYKNTSAPTFKTQQNGSTIYKDALVEEALQKLAEREEEHRLLKESYVKEVPDDSETVDGGEETDVETEETPLEEPVSDELSDSETPVEAPAEEL